MRLGLVPDALDRLSAADLDDLETGRQERLGEIALLVAWATHQIMAVQIVDKSWHSKFDEFSNFLKFYKPPFVILPEDDEA